ncbi:MAG: adenosylcobinamide amidohydrolase [bacterium]|nr:adenosylcobinamide amidohydrolase [bacterium]
MTVPVEPVLRVVDAASGGVLVWRWTGRVTALSSAAVGGGLSQPGWVANIGVDSDYRRTDLAEHATEVVAGLELPGQGVVLFTAADVNRATRSAADGVTVHATVGVSHPTWAAAPEADDGPAEVLAPEGSGQDSGPAVSPAPGTINLVIQVPVSLGGGAAVNAVITATEAKTQALLAAGIEGTGTATDAVVVVWPPAAPPERFAGPRSPLGGRIARCVHEAVRSGLER